ncbi:hypothetical protein F444_10810 [Phytophthora nicotianae P1976]|uniref:Peptidase M10 metallopeptidase domain-containing protein n=1 Tax=Phytophthora nicotianae P1976 TaxID=1317066 RepID=A0A081A2W6_PHYNI|nr:hypothetical protein F444_10810 [Phytophthora nicotianae P1976]
MRPRPPSYVLLVATLAAPSSAFDFGGGNEQTAGTVAPDVSTDRLTPTAGGNGFGNFGIPTQFVNPPTGESTGISQGWPPRDSKQDWQAGPAVGWPSNQGGDQGQAGFPSYPGGDKGQMSWPINPGGDQGQAGWPSNGGGDQGWGALGVDCSGSNGGGWTPPGGDQDWGTLGVDCSGSSAGGWQQPGEDQGWTPPSEDQGWGTLGVDCSGSSEGGWTPPSGEEGSGTLGVDCSGSNAGVSTPETGVSFPGSNAGGGSEGTPDASMTGSSDSVPMSPSSSTGIEAQSSTEIPTVAETSLPSSGNGDLGLSEATQTATESSTPSESSVGADADQKSMLRSSDDTNQQQFEGQEQLQQGETTAGGDVVQSMSVWGAPVVASTGTNLTSAEPTFGKITSKAGGCVVAKPTEYISEEYLDWIWQNRIGPNAKPKQDVNWNVMASKNFLMDKFVHNKGSINYCVRWDSSTTLSKGVASPFQGILERHFNKWNKWLEGYNCWPFKKLKVNMVGWAAKDKSQFEWTDDTLGPFYEGSVDSDGVPQCPDECYRYYDNVNNIWSDTSSCQGEPFDVSFWLNDKIPYGFGYDWGQEVSLNDTLSNLYDENILFIGHEIGHGFGLPDFYGLETKPSKDFPNSIMMAYSSTTITPSDGWMLRRILDHVRSRYKF